MTTALNLAQLLRDADTVRLEQQGLPAHFAAECDAHTRETYATFLAALLLLKGEVSTTESRLFKLLLGALKLGADSQAKLFAQAQQLDQAQLIEFCRLTEANKLTLSFILDALILCRLDSPLSTEQSQVLSEWVDVLEMDANSLPMLSKLAAEVLGLPNATPWGVDWGYSGFGVWNEWLGEKPLTEAALKAGIRGGRWLLEKSLTVHFPWTMDGAVVCFANQATLSTVGAEGQVTIRNSQLWLPRLNFDGAMKLAVAGVQVSGQWHEATDGWSAFEVKNLAQFTVADSTFNTPNRRAIRLENTPAQLQGCRFVDCGSAATVGGGIWATNSGQLLQISNSEFLRCAGKYGGGICVGGGGGDATLTDCSFIDCSSTGDTPEEKGQSAAGWFNSPLVDTLKNCRFVRSSVRGVDIGQRDNTTKKITFCAGSSFTSCNLNYWDVNGGSVVDQDNTFAGGGVQEKW